MNFIVPKNSGCIIPKRRAKFPFFHPILSNLPGEVDLRPKLPPVYDQGDHGTCAPCATAVFIHYYLKVMPSRLWIYWLAKEKHCRYCDNGSQLSACMSACLTGCIPNEEVWPYSFSSINKDPKDCVCKRSEYVPEINDSVAVDFYHIDVKHVPNTTASIKGTLAAGYPVAFSAFYLDNALEIAGMSRPPILKIPNKNQLIIRPPYKHAMVIVGYSDKRKLFIVRNSWGSNYGKNGHLLIPYKYFSLDFGKYKISLIGDLLTTTGAKSCCNTCQDCPASYSATISGMTGVCADINHMTFYIYNPMIMSGQNPDCNWEGDLQMYGNCSCSGQFINCGNGKFVFSIYGSCYTDKSYNFCYTSDPRNTDKYGCPPLGNYIMHWRSWDCGGCGPPKNKIIVTLSNIP